SVIEPTRSTTGPNGRLRSTTSPVRTRTITCAGGAASSWIQSSPCDIRTRACADDAPNNANSVKESARRRRPTVPGSARRHSFAVPRTRDRTVGASGPREAQLLLDLAERVHDVVEVRLRPRLRVERSLRLEVDALDVAELEALLPDCGDELLLRHQLVPEVLLLDVTVFVENGARSVQHPAEPRE